MKTIAKHLVLPLAAILSLAAHELRAEEESLEDYQCLMCHGTAELWDQDTLHLFVKTEDLANDIHWQKGIRCHDCHGGNPKTLELREAHAVEDGFRKVAACGRCHEQEQDDLLAGVHRVAGGKSAQGRDPPLGCTECHGDNVHDMRPVQDPASPVFVQRQVGGCGRCHQRALETYLESVHGHGLVEAGLLKTAVCASCHGSHRILPASGEQSTLHSTRVAETCARCHRFIEERLELSVHGRGSGPGGLAERVAPGGTAMRKPSCTDCHQGHDLPHPDSAAFRLQQWSRCGNCHDDLTWRYAMSLHGQLTALGNTQAAKCSDCHGSHDILPISDDRSQLSPAHRVNTCRQCHLGAPSNFISFDPHADHTDAGRSATLHYTYLGMEALLYSVFGFFGIHTLLWLVRSWLDRCRHGRPARLVPGTTAYVRFDPIHRKLHLIVIVSFLGLALTGLPLKYSHLAWAKWLASALGGFENTSLLHRICAVLTISYFAVHLGWLVGKVIQCRSRKMPWMTLLFGPDSPVPSPRDLKDFLGMMRWFFGLGPRPTYERWTYWEKFDYWAVFWGVAIIGTSGLMLWFPELSCRYLPGWTLNVAKVIHSEEALLATGFIFAIHFFNTHLRAERFPMDMAMLTGLVSEEELLEERPEFVRRMRDRQKWDQLRATVPTKRTLWITMLGGFLALAVGLALLLGMILALFR